MWAAEVEITAFHTFISEIVTTTGSELHVPMQVKHTHTRTPTYADTQNDDEKGRRKVCGIYNSKIYQQPSLTDPEKARLSARQRFDVEAQQLVRQGQRGGGRFNHENVFQSD